MVPESAIGAAALTCASVRRRAPGYCDRRVGQPGRRRYRRPRAGPSSAADDPPPHRRAAQVRCREPALEEAACNGFAAQLLIPEQLTDRHIGSAGPTAHDIVDLWRDSNASRQACARGPRSGFPRQGTCCCSTATV